MVKSNNLGWSGINCLFCNFFKLLSRNIHCCNYKIPLGPLLCFFCLTLKMGTSCCRKNSVNNCQHTRRNNPEERRLQIHLGGSLKPGKILLVVPVLSLINQVHVLPSYLRSILIKFFCLILCFPSDLPFGLSSKIIYAFFSPYVLYAPPISTSFTGIT